MKSCAVLRWHLSTGRGVKANDTHSKEKLGILELCEPEEVSISYNSMISLLDNVDEWVQIRVGCTA